MPSRHRPRYRPHNPDAPQASLDSLEPRDRRRSREQSIALSSNQLNSHCRPRLDSFRHIFSNPKIKLRSIDHHFELILRYRPYPNGKWANFSSHCEKYFQKWILAISMGNSLPPSADRLLPFGRFPLPPRRPGGTPQDFHRADPPKAREARPFESDVRSAYVPPVAC